MVSYWDVLCSRYCYNSFIHIYYRPTVCVIFYATICWDRALTSKNKPRCRIKKTLIVKGESEVRTRLSSKTFIVPIFTIKDSCSMNRMDVLIALVVQYSTVIPSAVMWECGAWSSVWYGSSWTILSSVSPGLQLAASGIQSTHSNPCNVLTETIQVSLYSPPVVLTRIADLNISLEKPRHLKLTPQPWKQ